MNEVKVGAPEVISGSQNSNVNLSVQLMSRCKELTLEEGATAEGSIVTAARLLVQLRKEIETTESEGLGAITIEYDDNYTESILNGHQVLLYVKFGDIIVDTAGKSWETAKIISSSDNANPQITPEGLFTINEGEWIAANVRLRLSENDEECLDADVILGIAEHPELVDIIALHPELAEIIAEWPPVINSLIDTGKRNWLVNDEACGIVTDYVPNGNTSAFAYYKIISLASDLTYPVCPFGASIRWMNNSFCILAPVNSATSIRFAYNNYDNERRGNIPLNTPLKATLTPTYGSLINESNSSVIASASFNKASFSSVNKLAIFYDNRGVPPSGTIAPKVAYEKLLVYEDDILQAVFVPFKRNDDYGMLNLVSLNFYSNNGTGQFAIVTEDK